MSVDWATEYARALNLYGGDTPSATLEQELLNAYQQHPQAVSNAITKIGKAYAAGKIRSPWGALKAEIPKQIQADIKPNTASERNRAIANAEQWMRNAGMHYDRWSEVEAELFGERGMLQPWSEPKLKSRMIELWDELRPEGIQVELDLHERAHTWKEARAKVLTNPLPDNPEEALKRLQALATAKSAPT